MRSVLRVAAAVLAIATAFPASAMSRVDPGEMPKLEADEGLVLIAIDSSIPLEAVHVRKDGGSMFGGGVLSRLPKGRTLRLYVAPAGRYEWNRISTPFVDYRVGDDAEYDFEVKPGRISYAGDLVFRPSSWYRALIHVANRGLGAQDWLQKEHPALLAAHPLDYIGRYPDPFPAFYRERLAAPGAKQAPWPELAKPPEPKALALAPEDLWSAEHVALAELNPAGTLLAIQLREEGKDSWVVDVVDLASGESQRVARSDFEFGAVQWSGDGYLLVSLGSGTRQLVNVIAITAAADGRPRFERYELPVVGAVLDVIPDHPGHILLASHDSRGTFMVHRVDVSSAKAAKAFRAKTSERLNIGSKDDRWWYADGAGNLRIAFVVRDGKPMLVQGGPGGTVDILELRSEGGFAPDALSYDGRTLYGITDEGRSQRELVEFDIASKKVTRTLFGKDGVDVDSILYDQRRTPIGVRYYRDGRLVSDYFGQQDRKLGELLEKAFPGQSVAIVQRNREGNQLVLHVDAADAPGKLYHLDVGQRRASLLENLMPRLDGKRFAPTQIVRATSKDGLPIEAYLTLPPGTGKRPVIVYAHGGPIGVSDKLHFDARVQFMASLGFAVLRVNFRGSDGYGKAFREAGARAYGTAIEDDIDAALSRALVEHPLDAGRMCTVGSSYGGFSALVSAIRWPSRFRCAVSIAGLTDLPLFFTASDSARSAPVREKMERLIGDPRKDLEAMRQASPLYRYDALTVPIMFAHGDEDLRVDQEHMRRLVRMLDIAGRPPVGLVFEGEGHGFADEAHTHALWKGVAGFLQQHLDAPAAAAR
ncbi:MAG: S9 family peptidase [Xanthomonadales bacterium]|nr:S9 family peptidase [Xanthomonadales bacterium]